CAHLHYDFSHVRINCLLMSITATLTLSVTSFHYSVLPFFFFNDTATTEIYTLSLHDALPIYGRTHRTDAGPRHQRRARRRDRSRSEEHTSELQSLTNLVCRLLLEKKRG